MSASNGSLDVSLLSVDSSCSSFSSISQTNKRCKPQAKAHRKGQSSSKYQYGNSSGIGRWHNPVDAFGSAGMNVAPCRKSSRNQLLLSSSRLASSCEEARDSPASIPTRKESHNRVARDFISGKHAARVANRHGSSKAKVKNFEWKRNRSKPASAAKRQTGPLIGGPSFRSRQQKLFTSLILKSPASIMVCDSSAPLNCTSPHQTPLGFSQPSSSPIMPPPMPVRKKSFMDLDITAHSSACSKVPQLNSNWMLPSGVKPLPGNVGGTVSTCNSRSKTARTGHKNNLFLALPPLTEFERASSGSTKHDHWASPPKRQTSSTDLDLNLDLDLPCLMQKGSRTIAPVVPQRKESLMDISDFGND